MHWDFLLILGVLGLFVPWRGAQRVRRLLAQPSVSGAERLQIYFSTVVLQWAAAGIVYWRASARGLDSTALALSLPRPLETMALALLLSALLAFAQVHSLGRLARLPLDERGFMGNLGRKLLPQDSRERNVFLLVAATAAACEEFLYRGFVFAVFTALSDSVAVGVLASSAFFAAAHSYQGRRGLLLTFAGGLLFAAARAATDSLLAPAAGHFVADAVAGWYGGSRLGPPAVAKVETTSN